MDDDEPFLLPVAATPAAGVGDAQLQRDVLGLLDLHPLGLRRADLRQALASAYADRSPPAELAVLDTRIGHALTRLKVEGELVHDLKRQRYRPRTRDAGQAADPQLPAPTLGDRVVSDVGEQDPLF